MISHQNVEAGAGFQRVFCESFWPLPVELEVNWLGTIPKSLVPDSSFGLLYDVWIFMEFSWKHGLWCMMIYVIFIFNHSQDTPKKWEGHPINFRTIHRPPLPDPFSPVRWRQRLCSNRIPTDQLRQNDIYIYIYNYIYTKYNPCRLHTHTYTQGLVYIYI